MTNPREALEEAVRALKDAAWSDAPDDWIKADELVDALSARIQALETSLAEEEGRVIAEVVAWLREEGRWIVDTYDADHPRDISEALATALETGEWKK